MIAEPINHLVEGLFAPLEGSISAAAPAALLLIGLVTGLRHSIEADHVAAVATILATSNGKKKFRHAPILGLMWGLGHTATLLVAGLMVLLLAVSIPEKVSGRLEFGVGLMLIYLGATALTGFNSGKFFRGLIGRGQKHVHEHVHSDLGMVHSHEHAHHSEHRHEHKSILVGMIHGMAGSGALMLVMLSTINSVPLGLAYVAIFSAGSIASMAAMSALIGLPFTRAGKYKRASQVLRCVSAIVTLVMGAGLMYGLGVVEQVFT